jgi:Tfp pilus assembly protein PilV
MPNSNGYLLLEILIAVAIFSIGFLAVGTLIVSTTSANTSSHIFTQASLLATETLECLKKETLSDLVPSSYSDSNNPINDCLYGYNASRRIRVAVSWERLGQSRRVELTTITRGNGS